MPLRFAKTLESPPGALTLLCLHFLDDREVIYTHTLLPVVSDDEGTDKQWLVTVADQRCDQAYN